MQLGRINVRPRSRRLLLSMVSSAPLSGFGKMKRRETLFDLMKDDPPYKDAAVFVYAFSSHLGREKLREQGFPSTFK